MDDPHKLERFVEAHERVYPQVCAELRRGRKASHWMWFVFPQIRGLGHSPMAQKFAIASLAEARAYLGHPVLGPRLRECTQLAVDVEGRSALEIFGHPDEMKFRSSMTLFSRAAPEDPLFKTALTKYFPAGPRPRNSRPGVMARHERRRLSRSSRAVAASPRAAPPGGRHCAE